MTHKTSVSSQEMSSYVHVANKGINFYLFQQFFY
jgi:hypothetical protein